MDSLTFLLLPLTVPIAKTEKTAEDGRSHKYETFFEG
jgi:hypothetical protein